MSILTASHKEPNMPNANTNLLLRNDTILGVCEAIGQDFGFHPNWLRVAFALAVYFAPVAVISTYLALGVIVAISRKVAPDQQVAAPQLTSAKSEELALAA